MRHNRAGKKLNRDIKERKSLFKNLAISLVDKGRIVTTEPKAKAMKGLVDKLITTAKKGTLASKRQLLAFFNRRDTVNKLEEVIAPAMKDRNSGYTRIIKKGERLGDGATEVVFEWTEKIEVAPVIVQKEKKAGKEEKRPKEIAKPKSSKK